MKIKLRSAPGCQIIELGGEVDAASALALDEAVANALRQPEANVLLDCTHLTYISSAGLGVIISYLKEFEEQKRRLILFGVNDQVLGVFKILGLENLLELAPDEQQALAINER